MGVSGESWDTLLRVDFLVGWFAGGWLVCIQEENEEGNSGFSNW